MSENLPIVSICCITYNHAPFIRKALDGFLMQEPPTGVSADEPWYEILIHDDCSTDGTDDIIREYATKYPDRIFPLYETENQYSKGRGSELDMYNYRRARGKYIAYCEGDDYWTDAHKLQKQVDFMDTHPDYSVCFHKFRNYNYLTNTYDDKMFPSLLLEKRGNPEGMDIDMSLYFEHWYTQPLTMLFRVSVADFTVHERFRNYRDMHEIFYLMKAGKCRLMNFDGGVRHVHKGGVSSMISAKEQYNYSYEIAHEWYNIDRDKDVKRYYTDTLHWLISREANIPNVSRNEMIWAYLILTGDIKFVLKNCIRKKR